MKTARSRILVVLIAAAIVVSFFAHWDDFSRGFHDSYEGGVRYEPVNR